MAATDIKIDRLETSYDPTDEATPYTTTVFATVASTLDPVVFQVKYLSPDELQESIVGGPVVDGGDILDFLP